MMSPAKTIAFTEQQLLATAPDASIWVSASAGTGKTQVLTGRVLRLLLEEAVTPENILCVTFTKAAAAEMVQRLSATLARWVTLPDAELFFQLHHELQVKDARGKLALARSLFARTLEARGGLKIQTLHGFCQSLLARFPLEAGITPGFTTLEERTDSEMQRLALDGEIARAYSQQDKRFVADVELLACRIDDDNLLKLLRVLTGDLAKLDPRQQIRAEGFAPRIRMLLGLPLEGDADAYFAACLSRGDVGIADIRHIAAVWQQGGSEIQKLAAFLQTWLAHPVLGLFTHLERGFVKEDGDMRALSRLADKKCEQIDPDIRHKAQEAQAAVAALAQKLKLFQVAEQAAAGLRISWAVLQTVQEAKNALGLVSFGDLIGKVVQLLQSGSGDWVRYKLDDQITHVLVDEAQDTNADQWAILQALTEEFFAGRGAQQKPRSLFVVGDYKQSIFRFQGADPQIFNAEKPRLAARALAGGAQFLEVPMATSFRSAPGIIDFVNAAIPALPADQLGKGADFDVHDAHRTGEGGAVVVWPLTPREVSHSDPADIRAELDRPWEDKNERVTAARIAQQIFSWLAPGSPHQVKGRPVRPADIMILVRKRGLLSQSLVRDLKMLGVPVAGADRMTLGKQLAVQDLLSCARFALQPEDDLATACLLKSPFFNWSEELLFSLAHPRGARSLWQALRDSDMPEAVQAQEKLTQLLVLGDAALPFDFLSAILEQSILGPVSGRAQLFARLGSEVDDPVSMLLDEALAFEKNQAPSLQAFVAWMAQDEREVKRDPDAPRDEVRVMTVHGSKGLQAPIIILADSHGVPDHREAIATVGDGTGKLPLLYGQKAMRIGVLKEAHEAERQEILRDYWRLFYVAITRAEDQLYFAGWEPGKANGSESWHDLAKRVLALLPAEINEDVLWGELLRFARPRTKPSATGDTSVAPAPAVRVPDWALTPAPAEPIPPRPLTPSQLGGESQLSADPPLAGGHLSRQRGTALHQLLELLPQVSPERRADVGQRLLARTDVPPERHAALLAEVFATLADPAFAAVFAPGSLAEVPVIAVLGTAVLSGQIDRLAVTDSRVLIVDYKTSATPPPDAASVPVAYVRQMAAYRLALLQIYPGREIAAALLWTATPRLMPLPAALLDAAAASFASP